MSTHLLAPNRHQQIALERTDAPHKPLLLLAVIDQRSTTMETHEESDDMRPEYDLSKAKRVGRKYIDRLANGTNIVVIEPDLLKIFPDSASVNAALRALVEVAKAQVKLRRT
jgi:hypothetical protein